MTIYFLESLYTSESNISEFGIFTSASIKKGTTLYFCNQLKDYNNFLNFSEICKLIPDKKNIFLKYAYQIDNDLWSGPNSTYADPSLNSDMSIYWNHSCDPNSYFKNINTIVALKDIEKGEELTYDYCTTDSFVFPSEFDIYMPYINKCNCNSNICRGKVLPQDWTNAKLQKKYKGQFLPYLEKKINSLNGD